MGRDGRLLVDIHEEDHRRSIRVRHRRQAWRGFRRRGIAALIVFVIAAATVALLVAGRRYRP